MSLKSLHEAGLQQLRVPVPGDGANTRLDPERAGAAHRLSLGEYTGPSTPALPAGHN